MTNTKVHATMKMKRSVISPLLAGAMLVVCTVAGFGAETGKGASTPDEFARQYMTAFNNRDREGLKKLRIPLTVKSDMQDMIDSMLDAELSGTTKYNKFEILPAQPDMEKPKIGPDGVFYKPNVTPTNLVKLTAETENGTTSTTMPIGKKGGLYYLVLAEPATGEAPVYHFGWQRFAAPQSNWSVIMPNEPEPGRAALEKQVGKDGMNDPDLYGVVKNTADIKTVKHFFICGEEGKRLHDSNNKETYRAACTTYEPETLKKWFSDSSKNLSDAIDSMSRMNGGKLVEQKDIELNGAPGKEFEIRTKDGGLCLGRVYWIKNALYELSVDNHTDEPNRASAAKFLTSLDVH